MDFIYTLKMFALILCLILLVVVNLAIGGCATLMIIVKIMNSLGPDLVAEKLKNGDKDIYEFINRFAIAIAEKKRKRVVLNEEKEGL